MRYRARRASSSAVPRPHARRLLVLLLAGAAAAAAAARSVQPRDDSGLSAALAGEIAAAVGGELHALTQQYLTAVSPSNSWSQYFNISRELLGVGFHRRLELRVAPAPPPAELLSLHGCQAWLVQQLPPGVFADPYELEGLSRSSGLKFQLFGPRDLELPAPACKPTALLLGFQFAAAGQEEEQLQAHATVSVPLHAKYPEPRSWGFSGWQALATGSVDVQLPWPWLLVDCLASEGGVVVLRPPADPLADEQQCSAASAPQHGQCGGSGSLVWSVPAGSLDHERLVSWGSLLAAAACFLVVARKAVATARRRAQQPA